MLEIFIPIDVNKDYVINNFSSKLRDLLEEKFIDIKIENFNSNFINWFFLSTESIDIDLIILLNGEFWEFYFIDFDVLEKDVISLWIIILKPKELLNNINSINSEINQIVSDLKSNKLLTTSKKVKIRSRLDKIFFTLSGVLFLLYKLKQKTSFNIDELVSYKWKIEYEWQASILKETSKIKEIELNWMITKLELKVESFLWVINTLLIK